MPTLIFDGECAFCRPWVERWRRRSGDGFEAVPLQQWSGGGADREALTRAVHFVAADGSVSRGAEAVFRALATNLAAAWPLWLYQRSALLRRVTERAYASVAGNRDRASRVTRWLWGGATPPSYELCRSVFLRGLAVIYAIAFVSFWVQAQGLIGSDGIWPLGRYLTFVHQQLGAKAWLEMPSLFLLSSSDAAIQATCAAGVVLAVVLAVGAWPRAALAGLWFLYLSLEHAGYVFLGYQWDLLLLEVGLLAIPFAPAGLWPCARRRPVSWVPMVLLRWLLFRLMFMSGAVKLLSHDPTWRDLTALQFHYWTQPLPTWTSAFAADAGPSFQTFCCAVMFLIELGFPFLIFGTRWMRVAAFAGLAFLQVIILATGNYGFFNWLTLLLCVLLLDDGILGRVIPRRLWPTEWQWPKSWLWARWVRRVGLGAFAAVYVAASFGTLVFRFERRGGGPESLAWLLEAVSPLRSINGYGLFAVMTTERPEILVEGSDDGESWKPYEFEWKPGRLDRAPRFVAPHQPRLDWQMWFAALGNCQRNAWFLGFQQKLLEGSPSVSKLLADDPFAGHPPRYVRSTLYQYRFASHEERSRGTWWTRTEEGPYCPELTLKEGELSAVH